MFNIKGEQYSVYRQPLYSLTGLRFFAALAIVLNHMGPVFFKFEENSPYLYFFQKLSLIGMSLFFVLSGFIIHYNYSDKVFNLKISGLKEFFIARFSRLYPLYILLIMIDIFCTNLFIGSDHIERKNYFNILVYYIFGVQSWFYDYVGTHPIPYAFRFSVVAWSISTEFFFYLFYPLIAVWLTRVRSFGAVTTLTFFSYIISVGLIYFMRSERAAIDAWATLHFGVAAALPTKPEVIFSDWLSYISPYGRMPEFFTGCVIAQFYTVLKAKPNKIEENIAFWVMLFSIVYIFIFSSSIMISYLPNSYLIYNAGAFPAIPLIIFCCTRYSNKIVAILGSKNIVIIGDASYSTYMIHLMFIEMFAPQVGIDNSMENFAILIFRSVITLILVHLVALGIFNFFEIPMRRYFRNTKRKIVPAVLCSGAILVCGILLFMATKSNFDKRLEDLNLIRSALNSFHAEKGYYPKSDGVTVKSDGVQDPRYWIQDLAPKYVSRIPIDPRRSSESHKQYLYISNGADYKIIAHGVEDITEVSGVRPDMIDPRRSDYAYGFWTPNARNW